MRNGVNIPDKIKDSSKPNDILKKNTLIRVSSKNRSFFNQFKKNTDFCHCAIKRSKEYDSIYGSLNFDWRKIKQIWDEPTNENWPIKNLVFPLLIYIRNNFSLFIFCVQQMRAAWTINAIPASQQQQQQQSVPSKPQSQQQQPSSNLQHYFPTNQKTPSAATVSVPVPVSAPPPRSIADEYVASDLPNAVRRIFWPDIVNTPYFRDKVNANLQPTPQQPTSSVQQFNHPAQIVSVKWKILTPTPWKTTAI